MKKLFPILFIVALAILFFWQFIIKGVLPIPGDTIIGLYHPFRDLYAKDYPNGIPFKNFLITDPVRQQFPWRELAVTIEKRFELPLWNPYSFSGAPLLANLQSAPFYPLNILFFILPFSLAWSILIFLEPFLGGIFLYLYLNNLRLNKWASLLGTISFSFSGFFVAWMEWGTVLHVGLWLPLILFSIDKIFYVLQSRQIINSKYKTENIHIKNKKLLIRSFIFIFSLASSFFAGHLQTFFYLFLFSTTYFFVRWIQFGRKKRMLFLFIILNSLFIILTSIQWPPTLQFIFLSARDVDQTSWQNPGWFIPWQNLIQFIAPDFFGNPATLNYWGAWNYAEFIGYIGIFPLIMAIFALFFRHDKKTLFFGSIFFISLVFSLPTFLAKLPFILNIPFLSTSQPTRLLFITDFCLAILLTLGFDYFYKNKKGIFYSLGFILLVFIALWLFVIFGKNLISTSPQDNLLVAKSNLRLPTLIFFIASILIFSWRIFANKQKVTLILYCIIVALTAFDLLRFGLKFTPFTKKDYLFPSTPALSFLQKDRTQFRIMTTDSRILPPNFSTIYRLQSVDGYDPLYLQRYGELIAASERGEPNISTPFGFNRIITPRNFESKIIDLLGVRYILSLSNLSSPKLKRVFQEGQTRIYENMAVLPRAFFVDKVKIAQDKNDAVTIMFEKDFDPRKTAVVEDYRGVLSSTHPRCTKCEAQIVHYTENRVIIEADSNNDGFLVLTDSFYPTWHAKIDGVDTKIYRTDYNFRGVAIPKGKHTVEFYISLL